MSSPSPTVTSPAASGTTTAAPDTDGNGMQAKAFSASTESFVASLTLNSALVGIQFVLFLVFRTPFKAVYEPRTYIPPRDDQAPVLGRNPLKALWRIARADHRDILKKNGVDPYVFVRFLRLMFRALIPIWLLSWVILLPVDSVGTTGFDEKGVVKQGLDRFTFGNIIPSKADRYWAHLILTYVFDGWFIFLLWREMRHWLVVRQRYLTSPRHSKLAQASTVLITSIPKQYMDEREIAKLFSHLPGGVKRVWLNRNLKEMPSMWQRRLQACSALETAQVQLIKKARLLQAEKEKKPHEHQDQHIPPPTATAEEGQQPPSATDLLVPRDQRPMKRLKPSWAPFSLGWLGIGAKVDMIEWCQNEIHHCTNSLNESRGTYLSDTESPGTKEDTYPPLSSAFVQFHNQLAAHMAKQCVPYNQPYKMNRRFIEQSPANVIWMNMSLGSYEVNVRTLVSYAATVGLLIAWSFPSTFIGAMSNVTNLVHEFKWMSWILGDSSAKKVLRGVITGILPPILLALLMLVLPMILRAMCTYQGMVSKTEVELAVMDRYFLFLVVHSFLIVTLSSGIIASIGPIIQNPTSVGEILATRLPMASTFFITLILSQLAGAVRVLLQPISLAIYYILVILGRGTPRSIFKSRYRMPVPTWGSDFPNITIYAVIMITYMIISPIIVGFGAVFALISYFAYKYIYLWVAEQEPHMDTGGMFFPKAVTHVFVGLYLQQICLTALFFLRKAIPQAILTIILIAATAGVQYILNVSYDPLLYCLPLNLSHLTYGMDKDDKHADSIDTMDESVAAFNDDKPSVNDEKPTIDEKEGNSDAQSSDAVSDEKSPGQDVQAPIADPDSKERLSVEKQPISEGGSKGEELPSYAVSKEKEACCSAEGQGEDPTPPEGWEVVNQRDAEAGNDENGEEPFFAVPGGLGVFRHVHEDGDDPNAFYHPATKDPQRIVWLPRDELGVAQAEVGNNTAHGVISTTRYAIITHKGQIRVSGLPPDRL